MTVAQLIEQLEKRDVNMRVVVPGPDHSFRAPHLSLDEDYPGHPSDLLPELVVVIS